MRTVRAFVLGLLLAPAILQAKVQVDCNTPRRPEIYYVLPWNAFSTNEAVLRANILRLGIPVPFGQAANLPEGSYYVFPVCPRVGLYLQGKPVGSNQSGVTVGCP